ncbi:MAG: hypothetical protein FJZ79_07265 [Chlorobi bacterium]|nr:hypothetical protein [Chlorobiota bacterium]
MVQLFFAAHEKSGLESNGQNILRAGPNRTQAARYSMYGDDLKQAIRALPPLPERGGMRDPQRE